MYPDPTGKSRSGSTTFPHQPIKRRDFFSQVHKKQKNKLIQKGSPDPGLWNIRIRIHRYDYCISRIYGRYEGLQNIFGSRYKTKFRSGFDWKIRIRALKKRFRIYKIFILSQKLNLFREAAISQTTKALMIIMKEKKTEGEY